MRIQLVSLILAGQFFLAAVEIAKKISPEAKEAIDLPWKEIDGFSDPRSFFTTSQSCCNVAFGCNSTRRSRISESSCSYNVGGTSGKNLRISNIDCVTGLRTQV